MSSMDNVYTFPATEDMTVRQALISAFDLLRDNDLDEVIVVGHDSCGKLIVRSSKMTRRDALWLAEQLKMHALGLSQ